MKHFILSLLMFSTLMASLAEGRSGLSTASQSVPAEVSALLLSPEFSKIIRDQSTIAAQSGHELRIASLEVLKLEAQIFATAQLATKVQADIAAPWTPAGTIVGNILYGPQDEVFTDGVFYKPEGSPPGGSSVGNH